MIAIEKSSGSIPSITSVSFEQGTKERRDWAQIACDDIVSCQSSSQQNCGCDPHSYRPIARVMVLHRNDRN